MIRPATPPDALQISKIYNYYVLNSHSTFELDEVTADDMRSRIERDTRTYGLPWLVCEENGEIVGYSYATKWKQREAYRRTVESTVYLKHSAFGKGLGSKLYLALIEELRKLDIHVVLGGIALPNEGSIVLHEKLGFRKVGVLKAVGYKFDRWIDVGYWELLI